MKKNKNAFAGEETKIRKITTKATGLIFNRFI